MATNIRKSDLDGWTIEGWTCDSCGKTLPAADYVPEEEGWQSLANGDFCPDCFKELEGEEENDREN